VGNGYEAEAGAGAWRTARALAHAAVRGRLYAKSAPCTRWAAQRYKSAPCVRCTSAVQERALYPVGGTAVQERGVYVADGAVRGRGLYGPWPTQRYEGVGTLRGRGVYPVGGTAVQERGVYVADGAVRGRGLSLAHAALRGRGVYLAHAAVLYTGTRARRFTVDAAVREAPCTQWTQRYANSAPCTWWTQRYESTPCSSYPVGQRRVRGGRDMSVGE